MQANRNFIDYPAADEFYSSAAFEGSTGQVDVKIAKRRLVWLYIFNKKNATLYVRLGNALGDADQDTKMAPLPVPSNGFVSVTYGGGRRFETGVRLMVFTDAACTAQAATDDLWVDAGYTAYA